MAVLNAYSIIEKIEALSLKFYGDHTLTRTLLTSCFISAYAELQPEQRALIDLYCGTIINEHKSTLKDTTQ
jgi:hypothetical protein